jgi:hypothetical protein
MEGAATASLSNAADAANAAENVRVREFTRAGDREIVRESRMNTDASNGMEGAANASLSNAADAANGAENVRVRELTRAGDRTSVAESRADDWAGETEAPTLPEPPIGSVLRNRSEPVRISESGKKAVGVTVARARREAEGVKLREAPISAERMKTRVRPSGEVTARPSVAAKGREGVATGNTVADADGIGVCETV